MKGKWCTAGILLLIVILFIVFQKFYNVKENMDVNELNTKLNGLMGQIGNITNSLSVLKKPVKEGFYSEGDLAISNFSPAHQKPLNISHWEQPNMNCNGNGTQAINKRKPQPIPLPKGELLMFANTPFKPECCPNEYSNSSGCACMTVPQYKYLIDRGGNNVPYSEY